MAKAELTLSSKNYSSWSFRGWLLCRMAGLEFQERMVNADEPEVRRELLLLSPSVRVPRLSHEGVSVYDTLAIAHYLAETFPEAHLLPEDKAARAHCWAICGEMHSGFYNLRSALPMNIKAKHQQFKIFSGARPDVERIQEIWSECLGKYGGPYLFGESLTIADAMFAPVCSRFHTYSIALTEDSQRYCDKIWSWDLMQEWVEAARAEPEEIFELEVEF